MGEARMFGWRRVVDVMPEYDPFFTPPYNEAKVLQIGRPVGHIECERLKLRGYSIQSVNGVPDLIESGYCPLNWAELAPNVPSSSVRAGLLREGVTADEVVGRARAQILTHASTHIKNSHPSWRNESGERRQESAELRRALQDAPEFTTTIEFEGAPRRVQAIEHLGDRFARLALPEQSVILTIAGQPATFEESFTLRLPRPE